MSAATPADDISTGRRPGSSSVEEKASPIHHTEPRDEEAIGQQSDGVPSNGEPASEKPPFLFTTSSDDDLPGESAIPDTDPRVKDIPPYVRRIVSMHDDPTLPTITFRFFILAILFVVPGAFLSQMSHYRTTYAPYSIFFVQIASSYVGDWWARALPSRRVRIPFTGGRLGFDTNPGPFSIKEHVLVTIAAQSGATYNLGYAPVSISELYFGKRVHPAVALFFMWGIVWIGYSFAAIARQFLIYDPIYPWFQALCQTALFETQQKQRSHPTPLSRKQTRVFWWVLLAVILWQFLPEFAFPMLGSLAIICWFAPHNPTANFVGAGFGGMGMLNFSLDWSSIAAYISLFLTPYWTQCVMFVAFVINCWILLPIAKFHGLGDWNKHLMSNRLFLENGTAYPMTQLLTPDVSFNETAYQELGPPYASLQLRWSNFFDYASYTSALVWIGLFGYKQIKDAIIKLKQRTRGDSQGKGIAWQYDDQLSILQRSYQEVPLWWYLTLFSAAFISLLVIVATDSLYIPWWTLLVAVGTGAVIVLPMGWLYALSNFQIEVGTTNELLYGLMVNAVGGHKNPTGASVYGSIAGNAWYRAQWFLQDQKLGHYTHIPPRDVFKAQFLGSLIGIPINLACVRWILSTKRDYLTGDLVDPTHQWTAQSLASNISMAVQYVMIGPIRLFQEPIFKALPYGFLVGLLTPFLVFALHRAFPRAKFHLWNAPIFFSCMSRWYGNISTGFLSSFIGGTVVMYWAYRFRYPLWARWNYILAAAFDAGFNFNMLLIFLFFGAGKVVTMPHWWGNEESSSERCFALE